MDFEIAPCIRCGCADPEVVLRREDASSGGKGPYKAQATFTCPVCGLVASVTCASPTSRSDADEAALRECARSWAETE